MSINSDGGSEKRGAMNPAPPTMPGSAFGAPRDFLGNRFVYVVISPRARGLSIGINVNPDKKCNFDCPYCEVNRAVPAAEPRLDLAVMTEELKRTLEIVHQKMLREREPYRRVPAPLLESRHVALSGDGEPTQSENFLEVVDAVSHVRALGRFPFFKMVLITNASGLEYGMVQQGLKRFTREDEVWAKLDGGTQEYLAAVNHPGVVLEKILQNILLVARQRPVIIQSLFFALNGQEPPENQIHEYALRLKELKTAGAQIPLVQIYSATRPHFNSKCGHLSLQTLSTIARTVRFVSGLDAEVY